VRKSLSAALAELRVINLSKDRKGNLLSLVPIFEMPQNEEKQKFLFRDKLNEQLKKAGIGSDPLQFLPAAKSRNSAGFKLLRLQCRHGRGRLEQVLDLLAALNENPYLAGIEELRIKCDEKNRREVELDLTVSTFAK